MRLCNSRTLRKAPRRTGLLVEFGEPAFNQIEPARTGGNEMQGKPRMPLEPALHARMAVRAVVVENQMQVLAWGKLGVEAPKELQKLLMAVSRIALANNPAFDDLQGGKERGGALRL